MESSLTVEFRLIGKGFDPDELNRALGLTCTEHSKGGENTFWILARTKTGTFDIGALCDEVVCELRPVEEKLRGVVETHNLRADFVLFLDQRPRTDHEVMYGLHPVTDFCFRPATMRFLSDLDAPIFVELESAEED